MQWLSSFILLYALLLTFTSPFTQFCVDIHFLPLYFPVTFVLSAINLFFIITLAIILIFVLYERLYFSAETFCNILQLEFSSVITNLQSVLIDYNSL